MRGTMPLAITFRSCTYDSCWYVPNFLVDCEVFQLTAIQPRASMRLTYVHPTCVKNLWPVRCNPRTLSKNEGAEANWGEHLQGDHDPWHHVFRQDITEEKISNGSRILDRYCVLAHVQKVDNVAVFRNLWTWLGQQPQIEGRMTLTRALLNVKAAKIVMMPSSRL